MSGTDLNAVACAMVAPGKGILAADESSPTIKKRFDVVSAESTVDSRRSYREMLFTAPGAADYIGGVILFDETPASEHRGRYAISGISREPRNDPRH